MTIIDWKQKIYFVKPIKYVQIYRKNDLNFVKNTWKHLTSKLLNFFTFHFYFLCMLWSFNSYY